MALEPDAKLVVDRKVDVRGLPLTPVDFFVFSRVEALAGQTSPTVADVIAASGQPAAVAEQSIVKLLQLGVLKLDTAPSPEPARPRVSASADDIKSTKKSLDALKKNGC
jgi:hypothetical protein